MKDVCGLRNLTDKLEGSFRNLKSLKVDPSSYGILLVPLITEKLTIEMRLLICEILLMKCETYLKSYAF